MAENKAENGSIESRDEYEETPADQWKYYAEELKASIKLLSKWHKQADKIVRKFVGKDPQGENSNNTAFKLNMFNSNVTTLQSMLYGNTPKIDVSRKFTDQNDDIARVASDILNRMLNLDVQQNGEEVDAILQSSLSDRLIAGLGAARVRYEVETQTAEDGTEEMLSESAPIEYYHWGDVLWGWGRNWSELPWIAFRSYLTKDEVSARFGEEYGEKVDLKQQKSNSSEDSAEETDMEGLWKKAEIWEIWDKKEKKVVWINLGCDKVLDSQEDPLGLENFFPAPPFFMANPTTNIYMPTPDYSLAQDLYNEIDKLQERISVITEAVKVVGVYDSSSEAIKNMLNSGQDNQLIPVENWALFGEKNGLKGQIDWMPLADIVNALDKLREMRSDAIGLLQQITGMSDIMRGELDSQYEGVGQSEMKAKFGSVRVQALQDRFAKFATDLFQIKAEIISKHFSPQTIAKKSNMQFSPDVDKVPPAIQLIKDPNAAQMRVSIRPESVAMVDYAQLKNERTGYLTALATFMQSAAPLIEQDPAVKPFLLQMLQWGLSGFKGASEIEGVLDKAIEASQQEAKKQQGQTKPDPEMQKAQAVMQQEEVKQQGEMQKIQAKAQSDMQIRQQDYNLDVQFAREQHNMKMSEVAADMQRSIAETRTKLQADLMLEQAQAAANMDQTDATMRGEMQKDVVEAQLNAASDAGKTANKINEIQANAMAKIEEGRVKIEGEREMKTLDAQAPNKGDDANE
jgi:hypothetical protein